MTQENESVGKAHILVRLDANHEIGLAHAIRVSSILRLLNTEHQITIAGQGNLIADFFPGQKLLPTTAADPDTFFSLIDRIRPTIVLVDHPRPGANFWLQLKERAGNIPVVAIDDEGGAVDADLIINGTVVDEYHHYPVLSSSSRLLLGGQYAQIRPEFSANQWQDPDQRSVVIVIGSADRARDWALLLTSGAINMSNWGRVTMIVGRAFPEMARLQENCNSVGVLLASGLSGERMAATLSQASVALMTGGMIVYEALAVGVPAVVFPQIENLLPEAAWFGQRGCIIDLGFEGGMNTRQVIEAIDKLLSDSALRISMSKTQRATVDGCGMSRAAEEIDRLLTKQLASANPRAVATPEPLP